MSMWRQVKTVLEVDTADSIHVDEVSGRCYSYNKETNQTQWLTDDNQDDDEKGEATQGETKNQSAADSIHVDETSGRRYSYNKKTDQTQWLEDDDEEGEATQGETKNHSTKRKLFRRIVGGEEDDYFVNVETGENGIRSGYC